MSKYPNKKVKTYIEKKIASIEKYSRKMIKNDFYYAPFDNEAFNYEKIRGIELIDLEFSKPKVDYKEYTNKLLFDLKFSLKYKDTLYIFEVSNYYFYENENEFIVEDILENIGALISRFDFLLEKEEFIFDNNEEASDDDGMTIDDVADLCGMYIDDDGHWMPKENDCYFDDFDLESVFKDNLSFENGYYVYDDIDDNGKFYWKA